MTINIQFGEKTVRVAVEINGAIESAMTYLPEREWVGLTDEERIDIAYDAKRDEVVAVKLTEAKLKEKNATQ